jgi:Uma2 family endonuclease
MALPQGYIEKDSYTEEEYLRWEEDAPYKAEYVRGEIRAMSGGTDDHAAIIFSLSVALGNALKGRDCRGLSSDMKILTPRGTFRYPDVTVVCGPRHYHGRGRSAITNPLVVVEVLSDSTEATDQGEKLREYQMLDSLQHYLLVDQHEARIEMYTREKEDGHWDYVSVEGLAGILTLSALSITLALADIYEGIEFDPLAASGE